jgi:hypothetical protein
MGSFSGLNYLISRPGACKCGAPWCKAEVNMSDVNFSVYDQPTNIRIGWKYKARANTFMLFQRRSKMFYNIDKKSASKKWFVKVIGSP